MRKKFVLAIGLLAFALPSFGTVTTINSTDFSSPTVVTFSTSGTWILGSPYTEAGASFTGGSDTIYTYLGILDIGFISSAGGTLAITLDQPYNRFGFTADPSNPSIGNPVPFGVSSVDFFSSNNFSGTPDSYTTPASLGPNPTFFGLQNTNSFQSLLIHFSAATASGFSPYLDDFKFEAGTLSSGTPEPASLVLIGAGLTAVALLGRRKFRR